jgi:hypothetical protein
LLFCTTYTSGNATKIINGINCQYQNICHKSQRIPWNSQALAPKDFSFFGSRISRNNSSSPNILNPQPIKIEERIPPDSFY